MRQGRTPEGRKCGSLGKLQLLRRSPRRALGAVPPVLMTRFDVFANPVLQVEGEPVVSVAQFIAAVPVTILSQPVARFDAAPEAITYALDMLT
ncbi:hypothetical protein CJ301_07150 [Limimaricola cinnabarinus]|uniref:Toxin CcdB n=2 Tax=Limimaricola cinnabarinus TaxID=1125964 RepID=A0A2G1MHR6_9RHOB|nr:hypothetical protein CJ301_07150 [Limimaricola cinnabarinus]